MGGSVLSKFLDGMVTFFEVILSTLLLLLVRVESVAGLCKWEYTTPNVGVGFIATFMLVNVEVVSAACCFLVSAIKLLTTIECANRSITCEVLLFPSHGSLP